MRSHAHDGTRLLAGIDWRTPKPAFVDIDVIQLLTAACLVESRGDSYGVYLSRVFSGDKHFSAEIEQWSREENEHGIALSTWLERSVPKFEFGALLKRYNEDIRLAYLDSNTTSSIRGSKAAELLSRCCVEAGTSTYYKAMAATVQDKALSLICTRLARDEINHYRLFKKKLDELREVEDVTPLSLAVQSFRRFSELGDDQVSYAYYLARNPSGTYDGRYYSNLMTRSMFRLYSNDRISELVKLNLGAYGIAKRGLFGMMSSKFIARFLTFSLHHYVALRILVLNHKIDMRRIRYYLKLGISHG
jgi:rubrerythrin